MEAAGGAKLNGVESELEAIAKPAPLNVPSLAKNSPSDRSLTQSLHTKAVEEEKMRMGEEPCPVAQAKGTVENVGQDLKQPQLHDVETGPRDAELVESGPLLNMLMAVAGSRVQIRSQQKDEPDFTLQQKLEMLLELYRSKPVVFLERFRKALQQEHLVCFSHLQGDYEVDFYCREISKSSLKKSDRTCLRNKRFAALQQLIQGGDYFSDEQMRSRDPLLYEHYVGQYLTDEEAVSLSSGAVSEQHCLSDFLLNSFQEQTLQRRLHVQQEQEEACMEEEEEEDEEEDMQPELEDWVPDSEEKALLREELVTQMHQRFLDGRDRDFDYSEVDDNPDLDNLDIVTRDEEESYFDEEEPEEVGDMKDEEEEVTSEMPVLARRDESIQCRQMTSPKRNG
ncbi:coiled-coil domain-containing protein 97 isoform X2 [Rhinatrema bivittatum]|uniref:coiled-coil domain-containing protein 97 isoform X2 n=1 Tax=Rhinatrema bivittatum TaxID=194408 RepID=UPI00112B4A32|nr:coiled-coil domain-containing protein 97 isoform X2 [Rhinatrema bivittatum]